MLSLYLEKSFMRQKSRNSNRKFAFKLKTAINCANIYNACYFMRISDTILICWYQLGTPVLKYDKRQFQNKF